MKKILRNTAVAIVLLAIVLPVSGCQALVVADAGEVETRQYEFSGFTGVEIDYNFDYEITRADIYSVSITAPGNLFEHVSVTRTGDTLKITKRGLDAIFSCGEDASYEVTITMPRLERLDGSGASRGTLTGFASGDDMELVISGASRLNMAGIVAGNVVMDISGASNVSGELTATALSLDLSGASILRLEGSAESLNTDVSGASILSLADFPAGAADMSLSGASLGTVHTDGRLDADLSGASKLKYTGEPLLGDVKMSGASSIVRLEE